MPHLGYGQVRIVVEAEQTVSHDRWRMNGHRLVGTKDPAGNRSRTILFDGSGELGDVAPDSPAGGDRVLQGLRIGKDEHAQPILVAETSTT